MCDLNKVANLFMNADVQESRVNISALMLDAGTQQRAKVSKEAIDEYTEAMLAGNADQFPPVWVMCLSEPATLKDGSTLEMGALILVDGFQRITAACSAKLETFQARIEHGTLQEAIYASFKANTKHGQRLNGKDFQVAIKNLYELDAVWREHGKKKEIAELLGCSEKTVQRATKAYDDAVKAQAFKMFEKGASDEEVAGFAIISLKTAAQWRIEWETARAEKEDKQSGAGEGDNQSGDDNDAVKNNPLDMTLAQIIALKDSAIKAVCLKLLMDSMKGPEGTQDEPQRAPEGDAPWSEGDTTSDPEQSEIEALAALWRGKSWEAVLGITLAKLLTYANPKNQLKRIYAKALKDCHPDHHGDNEACELLKEANNQAQAALKANGIA